MLQKIASLTYTNNEFKAYRSKDMQTIADLKLKLKTVKSISTIETETNAIIDTKIVYIDFNQMHRI